LASPNDAVSVDLSSSGGIRVTLNGEVAQFEPPPFHRITTVNVLCKSGTDTINVLRTPSAASVYLSTWGDGTVNIGRAGSGQDIQGSVTVFSFPGNTALTVDDSADPTGRNVSVSQSGITGLAPAAINYFPSFRAVTVKGGSGGNTFTVSNPTHSGLPLTLTL